MCSLRFNEASSSPTLLCQAIKSVALTVTSHQQENNLINMVSLMLFVSTPRDIKKADSIAADSSSQCMSFHLSVRFLVL